MKLFFLSLFFLGSSAFASESEIPGQAAVPKTSSATVVETETSSDFAEETKTSAGLSIVSKESDEEIPLPPDFEMKTDNISGKYLAGAFLVYDCEEKHWVCVLEEDYKVCEDKRKESVGKKERQLPCAPIGEFPTKRSCFQRELYMAGQAHGHRFCLLDEIKKEELE